MSLTLAEIAAALEAEFEGDGGLMIEALAEPAAAGARDLALATNPKYADDLAKGKARAALLWAGADWRALGLEGAILATRGRYAMAAATRLMDPGPGIAPGIHPSAVIDSGAEIGSDAAIGPKVVIGKGVRIGARARIGALVSIEEYASIGDDVVLRPGVRICHRVVIGNRFIAQPNAVIGGDGFAFVTPEASAVETLRGEVGSGGPGAVRGSSGWVRIHSVGGVEIGDDVEIGSNTSVDRGTIRATRIGNGTKIDNQVQIGHNAEIGEDCLLAGSVGLAGSVRIGNRVVLAGQVGVSDNTTIGDDVIAGGRTAIYTNVPAGRAVWGNPAVKMETQMAIQRELRRLPRLAEALRALQKSIPITDKTD
jgi:UDP-3-O-[3-hydroxymyristoyl] glucosamine N-acyltransferase